MQKKFTGSCHCKSICFEFLSKTTVNVIKCNCSICIHTNFLHLIIPHKSFNLIKGKELISVYSFNTNLAQHYFCKICGIKSFYQPRSHQNAYSINFNSILNPPKINKIINFNGKNFKKSLEKLKTKDIDH